VSDSTAWRRFCRIPLDEEVPHPTTLTKITSRCGEEAVAGLNEALLAKAAEAKIMRLDKVRADTPVVEADVVYPTDSGLLAKGVAKLARLTAQIKAAGLSTRTKARDRTRSVRRRAHAIGAWLRRSDEAKDEAKAITGENGHHRRQGHYRCPPRRRECSPGTAPKGAVRLGRAAVLVAELERTATLVERVAAQTKVRLSGDVPDGSTRIVSLHDPDARPIAKGRLGSPLWHLRHAVHAEVSFAVMSGTRMASPKRAWSGVHERLAALAGAGIRLPAELGAAGRAAGIDDVLDAAAAAWTARRVAGGEAMSFPSPRERLDGRPAAIWA
jgi:hypothetical protein